MGTRIEYKKFSWTKWGARRGLVKEDLDEWVCQLCGIKHPKEIPSYFVPFDDMAEEYFRLCPSCLRLGLDNKELRFGNLLALKVANLLTLPAKY